MLKIPEDNLLQQITGLLSECWICWALFRNYVGRELKVSQFMSEFKAAKPRALKLLKTLPHALPHRKVCYINIQCS